MQVQIWFITGKGGFHFGRHGLGQELSRVHIPSDTLFSAFLVNLGLMRGPGEIGTWVEKLQQDPPPFVFSSAFPRAGKVCFFPVPADSLRQINENDHVRVKELKQIRYVSETVFRSLLAGVSFAEVFQKDALLQGGLLLYDRSETASLPKTLGDKKSYTVWAMETRPRVTVDRVTNASSLFHIGRTVFNQECGLWFGLRWFSEQEALQPVLGQVFDQLGDAGLGGERNAGFGAAQIKMESTIELPDPNGGPWVALSRYLPCPDEISSLQLPASAYQLEQVGGWVGSVTGPTQRRRTVNMLAEGSVMGQLKRVVPGQIVRVEPVYEIGGKLIAPLDHPVYRSGLALAAGKMERRP